LDDTGDRIRDVGDEYGTTTGRPRRCGWLDTVILRYAIRVNGLDEIALTKLDVLSGLKRLKVAVAYQRDGSRVEYFPAEFGIAQLAECEPIYEELPGWDEDITEIRTRAELPREARAYVARIEDWVGVPVSFIGVGPARHQAIV
jgi:adenylosuccinate synthase